MSTSKTLVSYCEIIQSVQSDESDLNDFENYIRNFFIPELDKNYFTIKPFLKQRSRLHFYNIKKGLIDLLDGQDEIRLVRPKRTCDYVEPSVYEASLNVLNFLNFISIYATMMKCKVASDLNNLNLNTRITRVIKEVKILETTILSELETNLRNKEY